jgi:hypothetical protein
MHPLTILWVAIGGLVMVLSVVVLFLRGSSSLDLGAVSDQWVAEHRAQPDDLSR